MSEITLSELVNRALQEGEWVQLAQVVGKFRDIDHDFSASKYGHDKVLLLLQSIPELIEIEKDDSVTPSAYQCKLIHSSNSDNVIVNESKDNSYYKSLFSMYKNQPANQIFAHFGWNEENGETWESPFEKLSLMAKDENWNFKSKAFKKVRDNFVILRNYLNYTFMRIQQQNKIIFSEDENRACFNTGLQTPSEKDIYATFFKNRQASKYNSQDWTFYAFADSYSDKIKDFHPLPDVATYIEDSSDLVFDLSYEIEVNIDHIVTRNRSRLPEIFQDNERLAMTSIKGATEFLKEKIRRNYKIAIPHWYNDKIQLLLPLNLLSDDKADLALVADKDHSRELYRIKTALTMDMAYIDARLICRPDREWLNP
ncbi:MAG: DUF3825 domain-containing protein [Deltaproteobacteria bacterium]|nr:DUF3825 domain-containing protein [Deltaproteobacteria bacterium]